jgi:ubiquinone/menaquinone biosynthesis C-methylase UbiE
MTVHESSRGYEGSAGVYIAGRPGYPPEALAWLREVLGVGPGRRTLEVGAGTGKFTQILMDCGGTIVAVEPIDGMRAELKRLNPELEALAGTAEAIPLPGASVDAVVCAQSFHWFATAAAVQEMRRVLVPGGVLGMIWNVRDESVPWVAELTALTDPWEGNTPRYRSGAWRRAFPAPGFAFLGERHARNEHRGSPEQVIVQRTLSVSFIANLPPDERAEVERQVRALIARTPELAGQAAVSFPYETTMLAYRKV